MKKSNLNFTIDKKTKTEKMFGLCGGFWLPGDDHLRLGDTIEHLQSVSRFISVISFPFYSFLPLSPSDQLTSTHQITSVNDQRYSLSITNGMANCKFNISSFVCKLNINKFVFDWNVQAGIDRIKISPIKIRGCTN